MIRAYTLAFAVVCQSMAFAQTEDANSIKATLDKAKATYTEDLATYRKTVNEYLDRREADARKEAMNPVYTADLEKYRKAVADYLDKREDMARQQGDKKTVDQVKADRKAFEEKGDLPFSAPLAVKQLQVVARKAKLVVDAQQTIIAQVEAERREFKESNVLPASVPPTIKQMPRAAAAKLESAFAQAIKEYTKTKKDDEATAVEKELDMFQEKLKVADAAVLTGPYRNRSGPRKLQAVKEGGGSAESEKAVALGLEWLAKQQNVAGYWVFDGNHKADRIAATGMCLLPFLAAGETHMTGKEPRYRQVVSKGLAFLKKELKGSGQFGNAGMYTQPFATIALCEAAGMTQDKATLNAAKIAVDFVVKAQAPNGSWGYSAGTEGDTSIVGWNIQALKSARLAGLTVPDRTFTRAEAFLKSVSSDAEAAYGYRAPGSTQTLNAVGLLCREYMGWPQANPALARGVRSLVEKFPPKKNEFNLYYHYYATQTVFFFGGNEWSQKWNPAMRDMLVELQVTDKSPNAKAADIGSWPKDNAFIGSECGKVGTTAFAVMILQVYYRHAPLYKVDNKPKDLEKDDKK